MRADGLSTVHVLAEIVFTFQIFLTIEDSLDLPCSSGHAMRNRQCRDRPRDPVQFAISGDELSVGVVVAADTNLDKVTKGGICRNGAWIQEAGLPCLAPV